MENKEPNGPLSWEDLREEFDRHRCSIFTTESSAPVMNDFLWFKSKIEAAELMCTSRVQALEEDLAHEKSVVRALKDAMINGTDLFDSIYFEGEPKPKARVLEEENKRLQERLSAAAIDFSEWLRKNVEFWGTSWSYMGAHKTSQELYEIFKHERYEDTSKN